MVTMLGGQLLCRQYAIRKERRDRDLPNARVLGRIWSVVLVCFSLDGVWFETSRIAIVPLAEDSAFQIGNMGISSFL